MQRVLLLSMMLLMCAVQQLHGAGRDTTSFAGIKLKTTEGRIMSMGTVRDAKAAVFVLLAPECPISQQCTGELNRLAVEYTKRGVAFYGVFPGDYYSVEEVAEFGKKYQVNFPLLVDDAYTLTNNLGGIVTPEVFVLNSRFAIVYSGAIDNAYRELGRKSARVTGHYLADALAAVVKGLDVTVPRIQPVGCLVEQPKAMANGK